jgi:putative nucleotidyltransferase with HDIG domain
VIACLFLIFRPAPPADGNSTLAYVFPAALQPDDRRPLLWRQPGLVTSLLLAILILRALRRLVLMLYYICRFFGIMLLGKAQRVISFFGPVWRLPAGRWSPSPHLPIPPPTSCHSHPAAQPCSTASYRQPGPAAAVLPGAVLGMTTACAMELSRPDHPLLQLLLRNSPGTYQHSLQVANLAEQAAEAIGADTLLTRVGAQYHDIGKAINPMFFIENQVQGNNNPHETLDPLESAQIIIRHIPEGVELARRHRIPERIQDFIREHHGTMITRYQYFNAVKAAGGDESQVDQELFRYPGPSPRSRETAILMLADGSEARVRAERPKDEEAMKEVIKSVIQNRMSSGQLDNTGLTLRDLEAIADSFTATLRGIYHPRIEYPALDKITTFRPDPNPTVPTHNPRSASSSNRRGEASHEIVIDEPFANW